MNFERSLADSFTLFEKLNGLVEAGQIHESEYQALLDVLTRAADEHPRDADRVVQLLHKLVPPVTGKQRVYICGSPDIVSDTMRRMGAIIADGYELLGLTRHGVMLPPGKSGAAEHDYLPGALHWPDVQHHDSPGGLGKYEHVGIIGGVGYAGGVGTVPPTPTTILFRDRKDLAEGFKGEPEKMFPKPRFNGYMGKGKGQRWPRR